MDAGQAAGMGGSWGEGFSVCVLGSGSRGNAIFVSDGKTSLLVDAGLSARETTRRLRERGLDLAGVDALLLTHEHRDHVQGAERLVRRRRMPVYLTAGTWKAAPGLRDLPEVFPVACGLPLRIGTLTVEAFSVPHDAREPVGFAITAAAGRIGIATDLGCATDAVRDHLRGCRLLVLEANHDPAMLQTGPYPPFLKQRIAGARGHLANGETGRLLAALLHPGLEQVILAHLSETNNTPERALAGVAPFLEGLPVRLAAARQESASPVFRLPA
ncbi:MAG: MBL fold metallo-hydrolase [Desulfobacterales bacterium]